MRIEPRTNRVVATIKTGGAPANFAVVGNELWVGSNGRDDTFVFRIDPATNRAKRVEVKGSAPDGLATDGSQLWSVNRGSNTISRIGTTTSSVVAQVAVGQLPTSGVITGDGRVWIPNTGDDTISIVDPTANVVVRTLKVGKGPYPLRLLYGEVWVPHGGGNEVWRIRP